MTTFDTYLAERDLRSWHRDSHHPLPPVPESGVNATTWARVLAGVFFGGLLLLGATLEDQKTQTQPVAIQSKQVRNV
jgi:hypothetical protein